jgi:hypothetical protein
MWLRRSAPATTSRADGPIHDSCQHLVSNLTTRFVPWDHFDATVSHRIAAALRLGDPKFVDVTKIVRVEALHQEIREPGSGFARQPQRSSANRLTVVAMPGRSLVVHARCNNDSFEFGR